MSKKAAIILAATAAIALAVFAAGEIYRRTDYTDRFIELHGTLTRGEDTCVGEADGHLLYEIFLENSSGIQTNGFMKVPADAQDKCPVLLILGGLRTGRKNIEYIHGTRGIILLALDYPYGGKITQMSAWEFIRWIPEIRRAVINTIPATMSAIDYLLSRGDVDPERIIVIGGSLGAFFVPAHAAADDRTAAAVMIFGAADIQGVLSSMTEIPRPLAKPAGWLGGVLVSPVEPLKYMESIPPRPLLIISGTEDSEIPVECSLLLHEAAREPKTIKWMETGHVTIRDTEFHEMIKRELVDWLVSEGLVERECFILDQ
jgi:pimeloyl-ACP methyl ester carboxylesterase